jgi:hypothetical protein
MAEIVVMYMVDSGSWWGVIADDWWVSGKHSRFVSLPTPSQRWHNLTDANKEKVKCIPGITIQNI